MTAFYNELDPFPARWLENLIAAGLMGLPSSWDQASPSKEKRG